MLANAMLDRRSSDPAPDGPGAGPEPTVHDVSVVVPVYQGEKTLGALVADLGPLTGPSTTPRGHRFRVSEVILVHDGAIDRSHEVIERLAQTHGFVIPVWLSRNFGQHPATIAGMAATSGAWVATLDEDGRHDPQDIARLLDRALEAGAQLAYGTPTADPPHGLLRNAGSAMAKWISSTLLGCRQVGRFESFRLVEGEVARSLAAYCGHGAYLDVALSWVVGRIAHCPVRPRAGAARPSGYDLPKLLAHFWRLVLTSGTRPLRLVALLGFASIGFGLVLIGYALWGKLTGGAPIAGWTSLMIAMSIFSGAVLFSLGIIAEYIGMALTMALGRPPFLVVSRPPHAGVRR